MSCRFEKARDRFCRRRLAKKQVVDTVRSGEKPDLPRYSLMCTHLIRGLLETGASVSLLGERIQE